MTSEQPKYLQQVSFSGVNSINSLCADEARLPITDVTHNSSSPKLYDPNANSSKNSTRSSSSARRTSKNQVDTFLTDYNQLTDHRLGPQPFMNSIPNAFES